MTFKSFLVVSTALVIASGAALAQDQQAYSLAAVKNMEMRLSAVEDQLRSLTGKVEKSDFMLSRIEQALQKIQEDADARLTRLEEAPPPARVVAHAQDETQEEAGDEPQVPQTTIEGTLGGVKMREGRVTGAVVNPKSPPLPDKPADYGLTAQEMYDRAFDLLRQADYAQAEKAFKGFMDKYPQDKLVDNAKYWYAETYYVRGLYGDAAVAFAEAYQRDPNGAKAPDSLLKLAMSLAGVEKTKDACATLSALKIKYPKASTNIKERAKEEWNKMKCK